MKFSVGMTPYMRFPDIASLQETVRLAEDIGFHAVGIGDHVVIPTADVRTISALWYDPLVLGTAVAISTQKLRIQFNTLVLPYHRPLELAKSIASLDVLSGGRVTVGAGVGWIKGEFRALGVPYEERGARTDECIRAMKEAWTSPSPRFKGKFFSFEDIEFEPKPLQKPHPPLWIGGGSPRTLVRAAEFGDGWHPLGRPWEKLNSETMELRALLAARGRRLDDFAFSYTLYFESVHGQTSRHTKTAGGDEATVLSGTQEEILQRLKAFEALGFSHLTLRLRGLTHGELCRAMERFWRDIAEPFARLG